ncbi:MAG: MerR family transcriptional regulator [Burkholderiales bacterium]|nr:MAG: MerR family transcriptional regulator [Burkholderiales bacterium]
MSKMLMIGDLAAATGTKVNTIRFYEEIGLMRRAARTQSGRRTYGAGDLERLRFIRHARKLGFETQEIRSLLALGDDPERPCDKVTQIAVRHLDDVNEKIARLALLRDELEQIARSCAGGAVSECRIMDSLGA